jgi:hypothetical protein
MRQKSHHFRQSVELLDNVNVTVPGLANPTEPDALAPSQSMTQIEQFGDNRQQLEYPAFEPPVMHAEQPLGYAPLRQNVVQGDGLLAALQLGVLESQLSIVHVLLQELQERHPLYDTTLHRANPTVPNVIISLTKLAVRKSQAPMVHMLLQELQERCPLYNVELNRVDSTLPDLIRSQTQLVIDLRRESWPQGRESRAAKLKVLTSHEAWTQSPDPVDDLFAAFMTPLTSDPVWYLSITDSEMSCIAFFFSRRSGKTYEDERGLPFLHGLPLHHYILFHTPGSELPVLLVSHANLSNNGGMRILHEILDPCKHYKRSMAGVTSSELVTQLLQRGVHPDLYDLNGFTALTKLLNKARDGLDVVDCLQVLLEQADPTVIDARHRKPLQLAIQNFDDPVRSQLIDLMLSARTARFAELRPEVNEPLYFPITSQWLNYESVGFQKHLKVFLSSEFHEHVVRSAINLSTRKALEEATAKDSSGEFRDRLALFQGATLVRKRHGLPDIPCPASFTSTLIDHIDNQLVPQWSLPTPVPGGHAVHSFLPLKLSQFAVPQQPHYNWAPTFVQPCSSYESESAGGTITGQPAYGHGAYMNGQ